MVTPRRVTCLSFVFAALLTVFPEQGRADTIVDGISVFNFEGACSDCTGVGFGVLTVQNYTEGSGFSNSNFVSFTYNSNLIIDLSITVDTLNSLTGSIPLSGPTAAEITITGYSDSVTFQSYANGTWTVASEDQGLISSWSLQTGVSGVPEPATLALMAAGLAGLGLIRRKGLVNCGPKNGRIVWFG
jgi:hypothetical protein